MGVIVLEPPVLWLLAALGIYTASKSLPKVSTTTTRTCDPANPDYRGRFQAQGGGLEKSTTWKQCWPPTKAEGKAKLDELYFSLSPKDQKIREEPYKDVLGRIDGGPLPQGYERSFYAPPQFFRNKERIDINVFKGEAFV